MKYALLIYSPEASRDLAPPGAVEEMYELYGKFAQEFEEKIQGGEELQSSSTATAVRVEGGPGGEVVTTDGPYAETKEQLGGFYIVEAADLDEVIRIAGRIPSAPFGSIEIRPVASGPPQR